MKKKYSIDPKEFSLDRFFELIKVRPMLPGRAVLHDSIDERLQLLKNEGHENLSDLITALKTAEKILELSIKTGLPQYYLTNLRREAGSYIPKPLKLSTFPGIPIEYVLVLKSKGIKNSRTFFEAVQTEKEELELSRLTGIPTNRLEELFMLCDLVRINGVGGIFARIIYESGIRSVEQFSESDYEKSYKEYIRINNLRGYSKAGFSKSDIEFCVRYAKELLIH